MLRWELPTDAIPPELAAAYPDFTRKYLIAVNPETRTPATVTAKINARKFFEPRFRSYLKSYVLYNPRVTDEDKRIMKLSIPDDIPTAIGPPTQDPVLEIDFSKRQKHLVIVKNIEGKRTKPANVRGYEIWYKVGGEKPVSDDEFKYAGFSTKSPFPVQYSLADVGKTVWYRAHWVNTKNVPGPWSEIVYAIIG
jgi:hypothetical protein